MKKKLHVNAQTTLFSKSNAVQNYTISFTVDCKTGQVHFIKESDDLTIYPYMLLHLLAEVYEKNNIKPEFSDVKFVKQDLLIPTTKKDANPEFEIIKTGKRYPLNQKVSGKWLNDSNIPSLVQYMRFIAQTDAKDADCLTHQLCYRYKEEGYKLLNPVNSVVWHYTVK